MQHNLAHVLGSLTKSCVSLTIRRGNSMLKVILFCCKTQAQPGTRRSISKFKAMSSPVTTTDEDRVRVVVRARPLLPAERQASSQECVQFVDRRQLFMGKKAFLFDAAFDPLTPQVHSRRPLAFTHTHAYTHSHLPPCAHEHRKLCSTNAACRWSKRVSKVSTPPCLLSDRRVLAKRTRWVPPQRLHLVPHRLVHQPRPRH